MAATVRLTRAESKARTRAELVEAARRVFLQRGYHGASLEAVAEAAGFSTGAVYSTFPGKADLFLAVLDAHIAERTREMERTGEEATTVVDHAERLARQFAAVTRHERAWSLLVIEFWAYAARDPELRHQFALRHDELKAAIERVIGATLDRTGERLAFSSAEVAMTAISLGNGLTRERLAHPEQMHDELFPRVAARIMDGLKLKV
jgi:AcrR family transcriptional regulator